MLAAEGVLFGRIGRERDKETAGAEIFAGAVSGPLAEKLSNRHLSIGGSGGIV